MIPTTLPGLTAAEAAVLTPADPEAGFGCLRTDRGNLPLRTLRVAARITGLTSRVVLTQTFVNPYDVPLEATYVFPLPDRGAVTGLRFTAGGRTVVARLAERAEARRAYDDAIAAGQRAAVAEEERPDVFTLRVGNLLAGEEAQVELDVVGVLPVADGAATFRFPLVVAPRYVPGRPLPGDASGAGWHPDTDAVPDASRITPPVLLPGFPNPVDVDVTIEIDPGGLTFGTPRSSLHAVSVDGSTVRFAPGERADRDVVLRLPVEGEAGPQAALTLVPDAEGPAGTFELTVLPPEPAADRRPRDVVLLLDRSGSMDGWKMVAARRAAARIVDSLVDTDRFAVLAFDHEVTTPPALGGGLLAATDRQRFRAVEFLAGLDARGGTELSAPMRRALDLLDDERAERVLVLVTDGQVGNEDQLLQAYGARLGAVRVHTVGVDQAVNAGFLGRLASLGGGRCELVESEDRLDEAMTNIHRRIGRPAVREVSLATGGVELEPGSLTPGRLPDVFAGVPFVVRGRYRSAGAATMTLSGRAPDGAPWSVTAPGLVREAPAVTAVWARERLRDLEDRYAIGLGRFTLEPSDDEEALEREIVALSLRAGVLCRFTAFVAVDDRVVTDGSAPQQVVQPVHLPAGWSGPRPAPGAFAGARPRMAGSSFAAPHAPMTTGAPAAFAAPLAYPVPAPAAAPFPGAAGGFAGAGRPAGPSAADLAAEAVRILRTEAGRLDDLAGRPAYEIREALADLGSRLAVLPLPPSVPPRVRAEVLDLLDAGRVAGAGDPAALAAEVARRLRDLADALAGGRGGGTERGGGSPDAGSGPGPATGPDPGAAPDGGTRRPFWKRVPRR